MCSSRVAVFSRVTFQIEPEMVTSFDGCFWFVRNALRHEQHGTSTGPDDRRKVPPPAAAQTAGEEVGAG